MVGKLARWLRVLGFDVVYSNRIDDNELVRRAELENRVILTRDTGIRSTRTLLIESDNYEDQIRQVIQALSLKDFRVFTRCLECNGLLQPVSKEEVFERIPPYIYLTQDQFARCPDCGRIYWHGTHADEMRRRANQWLSG